MPTVNQMRIPPPKTGDEFDQMVLSSLRILFNSPTLVRNGRSGQGQHGVDIFGPDNLGRLVGIQCKNLKDAKSFSDDDLRVSITDAETFIPKISALYLAFSFENDAPLQQKIRLQSEERVNNNLFAVGAFFWEDIFGELSKSPGECRKYYPQIDLTYSREPKSGLWLASFDLAYYGTCLKSSVQMILGEMGGLAGENPRQVIFLLLTIQQAATLIYDNGDLKRINENCTFAVTDIRSKLMGRRLFGEDTSSWGQFYSSIDDIETAVTVPPYELNKIGIVLFHLGALLARWSSRTSDNKLSGEALEAIREQVRLLELTSEEIQALEGIISSYKASEKFGEDSNSAHKIYNLIRKKISTSLIKVD